MHLSVFVVLKKRATDLQYVQWTVAIGILQELLQRYICAA